jgi:hypothetical protein|tara:strand:+ start:138 stop:1028 length:891 start_codon:yes stop_codon:yes gene_type:complete
MDEEISGKSNIGIQDSVIQGDLLLGDNITHNTKIEHGRRICINCGSSGGHTFFKCSTPKCENEYCEHCDHKISKKCTICYDLVLIKKEFQLKINDLAKSAETEREKLLQMGNELAKSTETEREKLLQMGDELQENSNKEREIMFQYEDLIYKQRTTVIHFSNNIQLSTFIVLLTFSDFILNLPHGFEVISYSFFGLVGYNLISEYLRNRDFDAIYLIDIVIAIAVFLISMYLSYLFSGFFAGFIFIIITAFFGYRFFSMIYFISNNSYDSKNSLTLDISATSYFVCLAIFSIIGNY